MGISGFVVGLPTTDPPPICYCEPFARGGGGTPLHATRCDFGRGHSSTQNSTPPSPLKTPPYTKKDEVLKKSVTPPTDLSIPMNPVHFAIRQVPMVFIGDDFLPLTLLRASLEAIERSNLTTSLPNRVGKELADLGFLSLASSYPWGNHTYTKGARFEALLRVVNEAHEAYYPEKSNDSERSGD